MNRAVRPMDLLRLALGHGLQGPDEARTLERLAGRGAQGGPYAAVLRRGAPLGARGSSWVTASGGRIGGLVSARQRSGPLAWEVERLCLEPQAEAQVGDLLGGVCASAARNGARYVFLRLPAESPLTPAACRAGFMPAYHERLLRLEGPWEGSSGGTPEGVTPRDNADAHVLFRLYLASVPPSVRSLCAMTMAEWWDSLETAGRPRGDWLLWRSPARARGHSAGKAEARAWLRAWRCGQGGLLQGLAAQEDDDRLPALLALAVERLGGAAPLLALVPTYQAVLERLLLRLGFVPAAEYSVHVKATAARVREGEVAPAPLRRERHVAPQPGP